RKASRRDYGVHRLSEADSRPIGTRAADGYAVRILRRAGSGAGDGGPIRRDLLYRGAAPQRDRNSPGAGSEAGASGWYGDARSRKTAARRRGGGDGPVADRRTQRRIAAIRPEALRCVHTA